MKYFDILYSYNWYHDLENYLLGKSPLDLLVKHLNEDNIYRANTLENHDRERIASIVDRKTLFSLLEFLFFIRGDAFLYMGQEYGNKHKPELFEKDPVNWEKDEEIYNFVKELIKKKKDINVLSQKVSQIDERSLKVEITTDKGDFSKIFTF